MTRITRFLSLLSLLAGCGNADLSIADVQPDARTVSDAGTDAFEPDAFEPDAFDAGNDAGPDAVTDASPLDADVPDSSEPSPTGAVDLRVHSESGSAGEVSVGVPFPPGELLDISQLRLADADGADRAFDARVLARWPTDSSVRSVLIAFESPAASGEDESLSLLYGLPGSAGMDASPVLDGTAVVHVDVDWLSEALVSGPSLATADNMRFEVFDERVSTALTGMSPPFDSYGVSCGGTSRHRTYYDSAHALWLLYLREPTTERFRRARTESRWYRANELEWYDGRSLAVQLCQADGWSPSEKLNWSVIRRMTLQGMLSDYLLTGDPAALEVIEAVGEAFVQNLPALRTGENTLRVTERNLAWTVMGVAAYYAVAPTETNRAALDSLIEEAFDWQAEGESGAFEHDVVRPDPEECSDGPAGGSPFMTSLLIDALMDAYWLTEDSRIETIVVQTAQWLRDDAVTPSGTAFSYLWGCRSNAYNDTSPELNNLIVHVFGAAYLLSEETSWLVDGDRFADAGMGAIYVGRPKQWTQTVRGFARYLGYRALGATP